MIMIRGRHGGGDGATTRFQPGDLVRHRRYGYRGVVVAFDLECSAPEDWYQSNQTRPRREQPWYHVLVDRSHHTTYAAQENLEADFSATAVVHPLLGEFFSEFSEGRYVRNERPWGT